MKLIYFHGFGSSAASGTIRTLREKLPTAEDIDFMKLADMTNGVHTYLYAQTCKDSR